MLLYFIYFNEMFIAVPGIFPSPNSSQIYQHIHQCVVLILSNIVLQIEDAVIISIGFYFIAILNIFFSIIKHIDYLDLKNRRQYIILLHDMHCNVLDKFSIFERIFYYTFTVQIATSVIFVMFIFFLLQTTGGFAFFPLFLAILLQFGSLCLLGQLMYSQTERFSTELYLTKWYELAVREQKMILTMMYMSHRPFGLKAAAMYDINFRMFFDVMKAGLSFCTLLYTFT